MNSGGGSARRISAVSSRLISFYRDLLMAGALGRLARPVTGSYGSCPMSSTGRSTHQTAAALAAANALRRPRRGRHSDVTNRDEIDVDVGR